MLRIRARGVKRRAARVKSGLPRSSRLVLLAAISATQAGLTESFDLSEIPSLKCIWMEVPHAFQVATLLGMVVLLCAVNRFFDRLDEVSYTRISSAISGLAKVRKQAANRRTRNP